MRRKSTLLRHPTLDFPWDDWLPAFHVGDLLQKRLLGRLAESKSRAFAEPIPLRVIRELLRCDDPVIILHTLRNFLPTLPPDELGRILPDLTSFRWLPIRREAIRLLIRIDPAAARGKLLEALTDRSRSLRSFGRFHLAASFPDACTDFSRHYLEQLQDPRKRPWALRGLAETDPDRAHLEALRYLDAPSLPLRKAALESLKPDALPDFLNLLLETLESLRPQIIAQVRGWLRTQSNSWLALSPSTIPHLQFLLVKNASHLPQPLHQELTFILQQEAAAAGHSRETPAEPDQSSSAA